MAHKLIAADLGVSSIKLARFDVAFRKATFVDARLIPCRAEGKPEERIPQQLAVLAHTIAADKYINEEITLGLPGDALTFRIVDLPFSNLRQIESVLSFELESLMLAPIEEQVIDFVAIGPPPGTVNEGETRVLAVTASRELIAAVVRAAQEHQLPLRTIGASPLAYAAFSQPARPPAAPEEAGKEREEAAAEETPGEEQTEVADGALLVEEDAAGGPSLVIDVGAGHTQLVVMRDGLPQLARSIGRAGWLLRDAIAGAFRLSEEDAEKAVHDSGFVSHQGLHPATAAQMHMDTAVREVLRPLVREVRQTMAAYHGSYREAIRRLHLVGGSSRLAGLPEFLAEELGVPVEPLPWREDEGWPSESELPERDIMAGAVGLALGAVGQAAQVNFRRGEFTYRSDYSFLRAKGLRIAIGFALVLVFAGLNAWASYRGLSKEHDLLVGRMKKATVEVFGQEQLDAREIFDALKTGPRGGLAQLPIPAATVLDLLDDISRTVPAPDKIRLDVLELDIKSKKTFIKATAETAQQVDDLTDALGKIECFEDVQKGKLASVTLPPLPPTFGPNGQPEPPREDRPSELKQFNLTIKTTCP